MKLIRKLFFGFSFFMLSAASIYSVMLFVPDITSAALNSAVSAPFTNSLYEESAAPQSSAQTTEKNQQSPSASAAPVGGGSDNVKGKIIAKSVSFNSGNLKYGKVSVNNLTGLSVDLKTELQKAPSVKYSNTKEPQVLIVHTHTTESYLNEAKDYYTDADLSRTTDDEKNLIAVGKILKAGLEAQNIGVVHATEKHDYPEYTGSYDRAAVTIKKYLEKYPTISVVIDLHRDSMTDSSGNKTALTAKINGQKAAQVMLVSGCQNGGVTGFPKWRENFRLALRLQQTMETKYPGFARPIHFTSRKYNQHITTGSLLIECGTDANTLDEAKYSAILLADCIGATLKSLK